MDCSSVSDIVVTVDSKDRMVSRRDSELCLPKLRGVSGRKVMLFYPTVS